MRHANKVKKLGRTAAHREAMYANMGASLVLHKRIRTTLAKAKALRRFIEPIINRAKPMEGSAEEVGPAMSHHRRQAFRRLRDKYAVTELFDVVGPKVAERNGGYTRILKLGTRLGDGAEMALIELVDFNEFLDGASITGKKATGKKKTRRRGKKKGDGAETQTPPQAAAAPAPEPEAPVAEAPAETAAPEAEVSASPEAEASTQEPVAEATVEAPAVTEQAPEAPEAPEAPVAEAEAPAVEVPAAEAEATPEAQADEQPSEAPAADEDSAEDKPAS